MRADQRMHSFMYVKSVFFLVPLFPAAFLSLHSSFVPMTINFWHISKNVYANLIRLKSP